MRNFKRKLVLPLAFLLAANTLIGVQAQQSLAKEPARQSRDWVRDGVIYEIYPRAFSSQGDFNGITARLDDLKNLGVTILMLYATTTA
jgi:hypothetical protein